MIEVNTFPAFSASNPVEFKTKIVFCEMIVKLISHNVREKLKNIRKVMKNVLIPMYEKQKYLKLNDELLWLIKDAFENVPIRYDLPKAIYIEFDDILKDCL